MRFVSFTTIPGGLQLDPRDFVLHHFFFSLFIVWNKLINMLRYLIFTAALQTHHAFVSVVGRRRKSAPSPLGVNGGIHFQLEELEDSEKSTTDIILNSDYTVTVGVSDGPLLSSSHGTWSGSESTDGNQDKTFFDMKLSRTYVAGGDSKDDTGIGEFEYTVERTFKGEATLVGGSLIAMEGVVLDVDEIFGTREVGFFNMIDTTEARIEDSVQ